MEAMVVYVSPKPDISLPLKVCVRILKVFALPSKLDICRALMDQVIGAGGEMISIDSGLLALIALLAFIAFVVWVLTDRFGDKL